MTSSSTLEKPQVVVKAIKILWGVLLFSILIQLVFLYKSSIFAFDELPMATRWVIALGPVAISFFLNMFFIRNTSAGANWARIIYLMFFVIEVIQVIPMMLETPLAWAFVPLLGLKAYAFFLIFTEPGRSWFKKK